MVNKYFFASSTEMLMKLVQLIDFGSQIMITYNASHLPKIDLLCFQTKTILINNPYPGLKFPVEIYTTRRKIRIISAPVWFINPHRKYPNQP